jgi:hypothetical protein
LIILAIVTDYYPNLLFDNHGQTGLVSSCNMRFDKLHNQLKPILVPHGVKCLIQREIIIWYKAWHTLKVKRFKDLSYSAKTVLFPSIVPCTWVIKTQICSDKCETISWHSCAEYWWTIGIRE